MLALCHDLKAADYAKLSWHNILKPNDQYSSAPLNSLLAWGWYKLLQVNNMISTQHADY